MSVISDYNEFGELKMSKLFVIGNGFDCYLHGLPTKYSDFRKYLLDRFPNAESYYTIPDRTFLPQGQIVYEEEEVAGYIITILDVCSGENWADLELLLGSSIYNNIEEEFLEVSLEDDSLKDIYTNEYLAIDVKETFVIVKKLFVEWVNDELSKLHANKIKTVADVLEGDNYFLNFNYTDTLESTYGKNNVCHIHGRIGDMNEDIYFGHGNDEEYFESVKAMGAEIALGQLKRSLRKDTIKALLNKKIFFDGLEDVTEIYSFGFSFSDVDKIYIEAIRKNVKLGTIWYLDSFSWKESVLGKNNHIAYLESMGFVVKKEERW